MLNPKQLESYFHNYTNDLSKWIHDGIIHVDLNLLHELGLLDHPQDDEDDPDDLTQYFHVVESVEKVTLFNEQFAVWIVPKMEQEVPSTYVFIALNHSDAPQLEIVFSTSGVYNTPRYVLKVLQHFLVDMLETEATLTAIKRKQ